MHRPKEPLYRTHLPMLRLKQASRQTAATLPAPGPPTQPTALTDLHPIDVFRQCLRIFLQYHDVYGPLMTLFMSEYNRAVEWYSHHSSDGNPHLFKNIDAANKAFRTQTENAEKQKQREEYLKQLEEDAAAYKVVIGDFENKVRMLQKQNENLVDDFDDIKMTVHLKDNEIKDMQNQVLQLRSLNRQLQEVNESFADTEYMELSEQNIILTKRVEILERELKEGVTKNLQLTDLLNASTEMKRTQDDTIKDLNGKMKDKAKKNKELEDQIKMVVEESRDYEHQIVKLKAELSTWTHHPELRPLRRRSNLDKETTGNGKKEWAVRGRFRGGGDELQNYVIELWEALSKTAELGEGVLTWNQVKSVWLTVDQKIEPELNELMKVLGQAQFPERIPADQLLTNLKGVFRYSRSKRKRSKQKAAMGEPLTSGDEGTDTSASDTGGPTPAPPPQQQATAPTPPGTTAHVPTPPKRKASFNPKPSHGRPTLRLKPT
eukprot:TRINITY_DN3944_c0_g1_i1.p1 TRINITY_DN3944_c0_g1~~TRINITY_DN3944_c0_g1_i1.p1  ORF type:complete len:490 (+),score=80.27 TRINITY_DN3944_c0_g1_i1:43-1512(+)